MGVGSLVRRVSVGFSVFFGSSTVKVEDGASDSNASSVKVGLGLSEEAVV